MGDDLDAGEFTDGQLAAHVDAAVDVGRIGLTTWLPTSAIAEMFKVMRPYMPPPPTPAPPSPFEWGSQERVRALLGGSFDLKFETGVSVMRVPTGEVVPFPTNTSDALTSGGTYAIAGAVECMVQHVRQHCGSDPLCLMTGGAGWKMAPSMTRPFELVDNLVFDGLLHLAAQRFGPA